MVTYRGSLEVRVKPLTSRKRCQWLWKCLWKRAGYEWWSRWTYSNSQSAAANCSRPDLVLSLQLSFCHCLVWSTMKEYGCWCRRALPALDGIWGSICNYHKEISCIQSSLLFLAPKSSKVSFALPLWCNVTPCTSNPSALPSRQQEFSIFSLLHPSSPTYSRSQHKVKGCHKLPVGVTCIRCTLEKNGYIRILHKITCL